MFLSQLARQASNFWVLASMSAISDARRSLSASSMTTSMNPPGVAAATGALYPPPAADGAGAGAALRQSCLQTPIFQFTHPAGLNLPYFSLVSRSHLSSQDCAVATDESAATAMAKEIPKMRS